MRGTCATPLRVAKKGQKAPLVWSTGVASQRVLNALRQLLWRALTAILVSTAVLLPAAADAAVPAVVAGITEEELLAISAAVAAYLDVRAHIRQVRLIQSTTWGQIGRLNVHASHQRRH